VKKQEKKYEKDQKTAPVIDVVEFGYHKVLAKGQLPKQPIVVRAKFFSKGAQKKIQEVGGRCLLRA